MNKAVFRILINSAIGLVLIFIWSRFVDLSQLISILKTTDIRLVVLFFIFFAISGMLRGLRLKLLLKDYQLPLRDVSMLQYLSQFLSFMIPLRAGEITKSVYLSSRLEESLGKTIIWVFVDRFLDFWAVLFLIGFFLLFINTNLPNSLEKINLGLFLLFSLFLVLAIKSERTLRRLVNFFSTFLVVPKIKKIITGFAYSVIDGLAVLPKNPYQLGRLMFISILAMVSDGIIWFFVFLSLGYNFGLDKSILGNAMSALTFLIPSAPGYVGSAEAAGLAILSGVFGLEVNFASAALLLFHLLTLVTLLSFGIASLYFLKIDLKVVWKKLRGQ